MNKNWFSLLPSFYRNILLHFSMMIILFSLLGKSSIQVENYRNIVMQKVYGFYKIENICSKNFFLLAKVIYSPNINFLSIYLYPTLCHVFLTALETCFVVKNSEKYVYVLRTGYYYFLYGRRSERQECIVQCSKIHKKVLELTFLKYKYSNIFKSSLWL